MLFRPAFCSCVAILLFLTGSGCLQRREQAADRISLELQSIRIPRLDHITIDGAANDWTDAGYRAQTLSDTAGIILPASTGSATLRLAWDERGLLALLRVRDDHITNDDSVDFYLFASRNGLLNYHLRLTPKNEQTIAPNHFRLYPTTRRVSPKVVSETTRTREGYIAELLFPWSNLNIKPTPGRTLALQAIVNDADEAGLFHQLRLYPHDWDDHYRHLQVIELGRDEHDATPPATVVAAADLEENNNVRVRIDATREHVGQTIQIRSGSHLIADATLLPDREQQPEHAALILRFPRPSSDLLDVRVQGERPVQLTLPTVDPPPHEVSSYHYLIQLPADYDAKPTQQFPTILLLHGSAERGNDLSIVRRSPLPARLALRPDLPFILIAPQCPADQEWSPKLLDRLLHDVMQYYRVDPDRITCTGYSMGGYSIWNLAITYPHRFAAIVPICGGWDPRDVKPIRYLPTWIFHGARDTVVPLRESWKMAAALRQLGADVRFTVYPDGGHEIWNDAYDDDELFNWILAQNRTKSFHRIAH